MKAFRIKASITFDGEINVDAEDKIEAMAKVKQALINNGASHASLDINVYGADMGIDFDFPKMGKITPRNVLVNIGMMDSASMPHCYCPDMFGQLMSTLDLIIDQEHSMNDIINICDNTLVDCAGYYEEYSDNDYPNADWRDHMSKEKARMIVAFLWDVYYKEYEYEEDIIQEAHDIRSTVYN